jgi:hypothetical protein
MACNEFLASLIRIAHYLLIFWLATAPLWGTHSRMLAIIVIPFLFFHWFVNDDTCALTIMECQFRGVPKVDSFMQQIVGPVYDREMTSSISIVFLAVIWALCVSYEGPENVHEKIARSFRTIKTKIFGK